MTVPAKRTGRRPGSADTRGAILTAARAEFALRGYEKATVRGIARTADVDAALVHHYFGSKEQVFLAALEFPVDPSLIVDTAIAGDRAAIGERLARLVLTLWDDPAIRERFVALIRSASSNEEAAAMLRGFVGKALISRIAAHLDGDGRELRVEMAVSQIVGLAMARYVIRLEPMASAPGEDLVALLAPTLQRYLAP